MVNCHPTKFKQVPGLWIGLEATLAANMPEKVKVVRCKAGVQNIVFKAGEPTLYLPE
jgi:hypothetical protein